MTVTKENFLQFSFVENEILWRHVKSNDILIDIAEI